MVSGGDFNVVTNQTGQRGRVLRVDSREIAEL